jgi:hypothetical protein
MTDPRKCAKQEVIAIIVNHGKIFIGSNWCENPQTECPRKDLPTGVGYEMCKDICKQPAHAEIDVCRKAGKNAYGGDLYLIGHYYSCNTCKEAMEQYGIFNTYIVKGEEK